MGPAGKLMGSLRQDRLALDGRSGHPAPACVSWAAGCVTSDCQVFWATARTLEHRRLDCADNLDFTGIPTDSFPAGWPQRGRIAVGEQSDGRREDQIFVHVSLDRGTSWRRIPVSDDDDIGDVLGQLG